MSPKPFRTIAPPSRFPLPNLKELWNFRYLVVYMAWRDVKVRFQQTILGPLWPLVEPIMFMVVFTFVFGTIANMPSNDIPYPIFTFTALVPWTFFSNGLTRMATSLTSNSNMITKIYFPRILLPLSSQVASLLELLVSLVIVFALMVGFQFAITWRILALIPLVLLMMFATLGLGLILSAMNARFRDVGNSVGILLRVIMYLTPVAYTSDVLPAPLNTLYIINPIAGVIDGFRWALLGVNTDPSLAIISSVIVSTMLCIFGVIFFQHSDATFTDVI